MRNELARVWRLHKKLDAEAGHELHIWQDCSGLQLLKNTSVYTNVNAFQANPRVDYNFFVSDDTFQHSQLIRLWSLKLLKRHRQLSHESSPNFILPLC